MLESLPLSIHIVLPHIIFGGSLVSFFTYSRNASSLSALSNNDGASDMFCEAHHYTSSFGGLYLLQPVNSLSSLIYVIVGWVMLIHSQIRRASLSPLTSLFARRQSLQLLYAFLVLDMGIGSMLFHASGSTWSGTWDVVAQLPYTSFLIAYGSVRLSSSNDRKGRRSTPDKLFWYRFLILSLVLSLPRVLVDMDYAVPIAVSIIAFLALEWTITHTNRLMHFLHLGLACLVIGYILLLLTKTGALFCDPDSIWQGHAVWHVFSAVSTLCVYIYFFTEEEVATNTQQHVGEQLLELI
jgi:hypothetical protein